MSLYDNMSAESLQTVLTKTMHEQEAAGHTWGVAVLDQSGEILAGYNAETPFAVSGTYPLAVAFGLAETPDASKLLTDEYRLTADDIQPDDCGDLQHCPVDFSQLSVSQLSWLSLAKRDDTATRIIERILGGPITINNTLESYGLESTTHTTPHQAAVLLQAGVRIPYQAAALQKSTEHYALRRKIETLPSPPSESSLLIAASRELPWLKRHIPEEKYLRALFKPVRTTIYPSSGGRLEQGRYDVMQLPHKLGSWTVAAFGTNYRKSEEGSGRHPLFHNANQVHAEIGKLVEGYAQKV